MSDATPPTPFETMLTDILKGQFGTAKPETQQARTEALVKVILAGMKRQGMTVICADDVVNICGNFKDADLAETGGAELVEKFAAATVRRILTTDLVMMQPIDEGVALCINIIVPGWARTREERAQTLPNLARMRVGGSA